MANHNHKITLLDYYNAYKSANDSDKTKLLKLSYKNGWYTIASKRNGIICKVRESKLKAMTRNLWFRSGIYNILKDSGAKNAGTIL